MNQDRDDFEKWSKDYDWKLCSPWEIWQAAVAYRDNQVKELVEAANLVANKITSITSISILRNTLAPFLNAKDGE